MVEGSIGQLVVDEESPNIRLLRSVVALCLFLSHLGLLLVLAPVVTTQVLALVFHLNQCAAFL